MPDGNPLMPSTLAGTGLCLDASCSQISADVHEYAPRFVLWADTPEDFARAQLIASERLTAS